MDILKTAKDAYEIAKKLEHIELKEMLADIREDSIELQNQVLGLKKENLELKKEYEDFKLQVETDHKVIFRDDAYWIPRESSEDGPFCSSCYDNKKKLIRLHFDSGNPEFSLCPNCRFSIQINRGRHAEPMQFGVIDSDY